MNLKTSPFQWMFLTQVKTCKNNLKKKCTNTRFWYNVSSNKSEALPSSQSEESSSSSSHSLTNPFSDPGKLSQISKWTSSLIGEISRKGSRDGRFFEPISIASVIPAASQPLLMTCFPSPVVIVLYNLISHLACNGFITVSGIFISILSNVLPSSRFNRICSAYQSENCWRIHLLTQQFTDRSRGCSKWVILFGTFTNKMFFSFNSFVTSFVIWPRKTSKISKAGKFSSNPNDFLWHSK